MRKLMLVRAIVVHGPDFFMSGSVTDEVNLRLCDPLNSSTKPEDDLIGELMRHDSGSRITRRIRVLLPENLGRLGILYVIEPALHCQFAAGDSQIPERQHCGVRRRRIPRHEVHFWRLPWNL